MRAGGLRNRVTIRTFTSSRTPSGQVIQKWEDGETIWAEVKGISGRELVAAGAEIAEATVRVWVRSPGYYRRKPPESADWPVCWRNAQHHRAAYP
jgi:SPP1 family predicted phage head-tail adaptor